MRSFTIGRIWDIPIRINISLLVFLPILAWLIGSGGQVALYAGYIESLTGVALDVGVLRAGNTPWLIGTLAAVGLFVSVTLHELGHSYVARRYGIQIESITLWILGGMAALSEVPREWDREFWIAIAGPATSVLVGAVCYGILLATPESLPIVRFVVGYLAIINIILVVFNLLPAFPMDGGRILRALLARNRPYASATRIAGRVGVLFAILFAVVGVIGFNPILLLLALFIYGAATTESRTTIIDDLLEGVTVGDVMTTGTAHVDADETVAGLIDRMIRERRTVYPVRGESGETVGLVALADLKSVKRADREALRVADVAHDAPRIDATADAFDTLAHLGGGGPALVVRDGAVVGTLSQEDYSHALSFQKEFRTGVLG
ncbi:site-2 protease family protein [Haloglomus litoreum]|uniref:site-2 protease family protein n=1 Tax=Haloglomus litoreum TaxID=3034026 RepID=UPI0023E7DB67|nr:site-2 protease family protein [Haloglomus sp. DT116]